MLRHLVSGALNIIIRKRTKAYCNDALRDKHSTFYYNTCKAYHIFDDYWTCSVLVKIYESLGGLISPLNTVLINHIADEPNVTAPRA